VNSRLKHFFLNNARKLKQSIHPEEAFIKELDRIGREFPMEQTGQSTHLKILMTSFSIHPPCFLHDRIFSYALRLRGAQIIPVYCDTVQAAECNVCGGVWKGKTLEGCCKTCRSRSELLWHDNPIKPLRLSEFISEKDILKINTTTKSLDNSWFEYEEDGFAVGKWAKDILVNNYVVGDYHLISCHDDLGKHHVRNLLLLKASYNKIIDETCPDRVVSNDSYYGMWAILQKICERKNIPFYSHWMGGRPDGWCYAYNDAAMNLDFSEPWNTFEAIPLSDGQRQKVRDWIQTRSAGKDMVLDTASLQSFNTEDFDFSQIDQKKPTALMPTNVIWDLAALNKQRVFSDMIDWIEKTIRWFADHPEYQLIIKPHPGELHPDIPQTTERVEIALRQREISLPDNVFLLSPRVKCTVYDLLPVTTLGIVHTTTVGIEMAAKGIPVITTGKSPYRGFGFTLDPSSPEEYFEMISRCFSGVDILDKQTQKERAYKFILFYQFHYYSQINIMDYTWGTAPLLKIYNLEDLLPGKNKYLDYFISSVIEGRPILAKDRWPPEC
jgi:hypothetical protein